jgi:hypothetical protein
MLNNYYKPTSKKLLKVSLALRGMVATVSGAAYFQNDLKAAFWFLVAGAGIDFIIQCLEPNTNKQKKQRTTEEISKLN